MPAPTAGVGGVVVSRVWSIGLLVWSLGCGGAPPPPASHASATPRIEAEATPPAPDADADTDTDTAPDSASAPDPASGSASASAPSSDEEPPSEAAAPTFAPAVIENVRAIAARRARNPDVFIKVGDSATVNRAFMQCFSNDDEVMLDGRAELRPLIETIRGARARGTDSFRRQSRAAGVGWSVYRVLSGSSSAIAEEVRAMQPRFALVMFGGNDVETGSLRRYESRMEELVSRLERWGVIPILSTIPPRNDDPEADAQVPRFNAALRALAERRHLPLVDLHAVMVEQPDRGLASDGVHPSAPVRDGRAHGCDLTEAGLAHGQNVRNLLNLEMIAALRSVL